jgi:hypothetical protein
MNEKSKSKGPILRELGGGEVRVVTTRQDWETRKIGEGEQTGFAVGLSLVSFQAVSYRESSPDSDIWDFLVQEGPDRFHVYLAGDEIFLLYVPSAVL